ncbi:AAA family ATPase [Streptomyces buecherae]|uniref:AAA family ATPase n=1 Tax=Streptomyces buecherae TaxID=2763006 RepID=UPI003661A7AF
MTPTTIRIGVCGAHSTGKSTLIRSIERELRRRGIAVQRTGQLGARAAQVPLPRLQHHTVESTRWVLAAGMADEITSTMRLDDAPVRVLLAEPACWDAIAYFRAALEWRGETAPRTEREALRRLADAHTPYDLLFATVLDPSFPVNAKHGYDARYRQLVDQHTHMLLREEALPYVRVTNNDASQALAIEHALHCAKEALA